MHILTLVGWYFFDFREFPHYIMGAASPIIAQNVPIIHIFSHGYSSQKLQILQNSANLHGDVVTKYP